MAGCEECHIPARDVPLKRAFEIEPFLNPKTLAAVQVPDGVFEPFRFCLAFLASAKQNGATIRSYTEVSEVVRNGDSVTGVKTIDHRTGKQETIGADLVINAAGPWAGRIAALGGVHVPVSPTAGVMVTVRWRLNNMVINRLNKPSDGDIVVPQRATSIIGTSSWTVDDPDLIPIPQEHVDKMIDQGEMMLPAVRQIPMRGVMAVARPLISKGGADEREVSRTFECFDHKHDGIAGFLTISGGKTTTARAMAEKVVDMACDQLGVQAECRTRDAPLASYRMFYQ
jgi:glycerol-3-phosphate dehydrogenase